MFPYKTLNQYRVSSIYNAVAEITPKGFEGEEEKYLKQQLQAGVIVPSTSQWASMLVLVRKKSDGSVRWCIDYRKLNNVTVMDAYPLPRIDTCLDCLSTARFFSTADFRVDTGSGYGQRQPL